MRYRLQNDCEEKPELFAPLKHDFKDTPDQEGTPWNLTYFVKKRIDAILQAFPDIRHIQQFHSINGCSQHTLKRVDLIVWINDALSSEVPELRFTANTVKHWRAYILNSCIFDLRIDAPDEVIQWFLVHYEDEPYENFFDENCLIGLFHLATDAYWSGSLDAKVPSKYKCLKERVAAYKNLLSNLRNDIDYLEKENFRLREFLSEHGLLLEALSYTRKP